jgi:acetate kinase
MSILVLNSGSSSLKFGLFEVGKGAADSAAATKLRTVLTGAVRSIGPEAAMIVREGSDSRDARWKPDPSLQSHREAANRVLDVLNERPIDAVGHRVVHGGTWFTEPVVIDEHLMARVQELVDLAPLHNPACLAGIDVARSRLGAKPMVAVFDTAMHRTLPMCAQLYAIPRQWSDRFQLRRYGFHGIALASAVTLYAEHTARPREAVNVVILHLGNGCSAAAIRSGRSVDTSMGFTPLEGLMMGTRSGDLDPALVGFLAGKLSISVNEIERILNEESGLLGMSGISSDMALVLAAEKEGHEGAHLAVETFCYRARKYLGAYLAVLGGADAVIFSGGIGEHAPGIRRRICAGLEWCGLAMDPARNEAVEGLAPGSIVCISPAAAKISVYIAAVEEELEIARQTYACLSAHDRIQSQAG